MKNKILKTATKMFLSLGVKSVTMDDIAEKMAISKKTIYELYKNKTALVKATTNYVFIQIEQAIDSICHDNCDVSAIHNLFHINEFMKQQIKEDNAPEYQMQKYYPKIFNSMKKKKFKLITEGITKNLERGIAQGLYKKDIDIAVIARLYYASLIAIKSDDIFPINKYKISDLTKLYTIYHVRAIATPNGLKELDTLLQDEI